MSARTREEMARQFIETHGGKGALTALDVINALKRFHSPGLGDLRQWACFEELRLGTGTDPQQRIDFFAFNLWPSNNFERIAYEIKVSKADYNRELRLPEKRQAAFSVANRFYFAAPEGLINPETVPKDCGLVEVKDGRARVTTPAPLIQSEAPSWSFLASIARRVALLEQGRRR